MEITISSIITFVTFLMGYFTKKFDLIDKKYIPYQNILIGLFSGILVYITDLDSNIYSAILTCFISSMASGGIYDSFNIKGENNENKS